MITSIITHYKRPQNMAKIVSAIRSQTVKAEIWIWDNSGDCPDIADVMIRSSRNFILVPKWILIGMVTSEYVWLQDDDGMINNNDLFQNLIDENKKYSDSLLGWKGKIFSGEDIHPEKPYQHKTGWVGFTSQRETDMINTGFSFFNKSIINKILNNPFIELTPEEHAHGDDIYVSSKVKTRVSEYIFPSINMINECGLKLSGVPNHMGIRNELCKRFWP